MTPSSKAHAHAMSEHCIKDAAHQPSQPVVVGRFGSGCPMMSGNRNIVESADLDDAYSVPAKCPMQSSIHIVHEKQTNFDENSYCPEEHGIEKSAQEREIEVTEKDRKVSLLSSASPAVSPLYYPDYLQLNTLLSCQKPISFGKGDPCHDEMLFITIHQTYELWFKQLVFELDSVREILAELNIGEKRISLALHRLTRIREIQKLLNDQIRVLETMTPQEFLDFRDYLFPASGFQSFQFRLLEIKLGVKPEQRLNARWIRNVSEEHQRILREAQAEPSLFDYVERWLRNIPFREFRGYKFQDSYRDAVNRMFSMERNKIMCLFGETAECEGALKDLEASRTTFESVYCREVHDKLIDSKSRRLGFRATSASLMIMLYQEEPMLQLPARLLHMLVDVDEQMNQWRYRHSQMVHRMIGVKVGTAGTLGHSYLKRTIDSHKVFADIANLSTLLIPRRLLPDLPSDLRDQMKYFHSVEKYDRTLFEIGGGGDTIDWSFC